MQKENNCKVLAMLRWYTENSMLHAAIVAIYVAPTVVRMSTSQMSKST